MSTSTDSFDLIAPCLEDTLKQSCSNPSNIPRKAVSWGTFPDLSSSLLSYQQAKLKHSMSSSTTPAPQLEPSDWNPLVFSLVAVVCAIFLVFSYYNILKRLCCTVNGLPFSRNQVQRQRLNADDPDDTSLQLHSHGLASSIIGSLPVAQFRKKSEEETGTGNTKCAVCLGEFEEGEWLKHLPNCIHAFHSPCIDTWFQSHSNCPLCRSQVYDLSIHHDCPDALFSLLETLRREDFLQERAEHYQILRSEILRSSTRGLEITGVS